MARRCPFLLAANRGGNGHRCSAVDRWPLLDVVVLAVEPVEGVLGLVDTGVDLVGELAAGALLDQVAGLVQALTDLLALAVDRLLELVLGVIEEPHALLPFPRDQHRTCLVVPIMGRLGPCQTCRSSPWSARPRRARATS